jgi:thioredoxin-dependent peroxiredoxin
MVKDAKESPAEGAAAPDFSLPTESGGEVGLKDFAGKKLVVFFYPRADTPTCTKEAIDFTRLAAKFAAADTSLLGVSDDPVHKQKRFGDKHKLKIALGSDEAGDMIRAYGVWGEKKLYGRTFEGVLRTTFLIDSKGRIARIWRVTRVQGHADEVLAAAKAL